MWHWQYDGGLSMAGMMALMVLFWVLVIAGILFLIWFAVESGRRAAVAPGSRESALDILQKRYARGEITREQYQEMRRELEG